MATSGYWSTSNTYIKFYTELIENSTSVANNTSNVTCRVWVVRTNTGYTTYGTGAVYLRIDGVQHAAAITSDQTITSTPRCLIEITQDIGHNSDGTKSVNISAYIDHSQFDSSQWSSDNFGLSTIPRYANITSWNLQSTTLTTATFTWSADRYCSAVWYELDANGTWNGTGQSGTSGTITITGLSAGQARSARVIVRNAESGLDSGSAYVYFTTKALTTMTTIGDMDINVGENLSYALNNPSGTPSKIGVYVKNPTGNYDLDYELDNAPNSGTLNLASVSSTIYATMANMSESRLVIRTWTKDVGQYTDRWDEVVIRVSDSNPDFESFTWEDSSSYASTINNSAYLIQNLSKLKVMIPIANAATAVNGSTMSHYIVQFNGVSKTVPYSSATDVYTTIDVPNGGVSDYVKVTAVDSRGITTTVESSVPLTVLAYSKPYIVPTMTRLNGFEASTTITATGTASPLPINSMPINEIAEVKFRYRPTDSENWGSWNILNLTSSDAYSFTPSGTFNYTGVNISLPTPLLFSDYTETYDLLVTSTMFLNDKGVSSAYFFDSSDELFTNGYMITPTRIDTDTFKFTVSFNPAYYPTYFNSERSIAKIRFFSTWLGESMSNTAEVSLVEYTGRGIVANISISETGVVTINTNDISPMDFDITKAFDIEWYIADLFTYTTTYIALQSGVPIMSILDDGRVGINCYPADGVPFAVNGVSILDLTHPVGSVYQSTVSTSPATLFGGTWVSIQDRFLLSSGSTYQAGTTGGEAVHTLTIDEIPSHDHQLIYGTNTAQAGQRATVASGDGPYNSDGPISSAGGGQPHNNMPPYLVVYMWQRTA